MFGWFTRRKKLINAVNDLATAHSELIDRYDMRIEELEGQVETVGQIRKAYIKDLKAQLRKARDETEFVIGAFSSEIHKIKTELQRLRIEDDIRGIEADVVRSQARAFYILGHTEDIPWIELENQARLLEKLMAARQEYQQTE